MRHRSPKQAWWRRFAPLKQDNLHAVVENNASFLALKSSGALERMTLTGDGRLRPILLICETVNVCNQDCVFCPYSQQTRAKGVMSIEIFIKAVTDYIAMGGGIVSLTPIVGDVLLDRFLMERLDWMSETDIATVTPTVTTNLVGLDRFDDQQVRKLLHTFKRIHISCYGLSESENEQITQRRHYQKFLRNAKRFMRVWRDCGSSCDLKLGFRNLHEYTTEQLDDYAREVFERTLPHSAINTYANWGNSISKALPGDAEWAEAKQNTTPCLLLATAMQVFWDGRVTSCACCDYDASDELALGNLNEESLVEIYNGTQSRALWESHGSSALPKICSQCTFHLPLNELTREHSLVSNPIDFIGG